MTTTFVHKLKKTLANTGILCYPVRVVKRNGWSSVTETLKSADTAKERKSFKSAYLRTSKLYQEVTQMNNIIKNIETAQLKAEVTPFRVGDTIKVYAKVKEGNRERVQLFEGTVLKRQGGGVRETFTVRKTSNGVGVEKTWPLHSPVIEKIEVVRRGKVRRAKLNYLRQRVGKAAKVKELVK